MSGEIIVRMSGRTAIGLRYVLPLVAEGLRHAEEGSETFDMLEQAVADIDAALPPEFRGAISDEKVAEYRMDVIDAQLAAGVRHPAPDQQPSQPDGGERERQVIVDFLESWRYCPVSRAESPSRSCLEDAASQLLTALSDQSSHKETGGESDG